MPAPKKIRVRTHERTLAPREQQPVRRLTLAELFQGAKKKPGTNPRPGGTR